MAGKYYVPEKSAFPICTAFGMWLFVFGLGNWFNDLSADAPVRTAQWMTLAGFIVLAWTLKNWFGTVISENLQGKTSEQLRHSYVLAMKWFIFSEVMFFAGFFGALFYVRHFVIDWLGGVSEVKGVTHMLWENFQSAWPVMSNPDNTTYVPPKHSMAAEGGILGFNWIDFGYLPFLNTVILVTSSFTVHMAHLALKKNEQKKTVAWLFLTVALGYIFVVLQGYEYYHAYVELGLTLNSGIYGTTFFMLTGFHGAHVTMGATMLLVGLVRAIKGHFKPDNHSGFEAASWYWHFVDVVWIFLFVFVYLF